MKQIYFLRHAKSSWENERLTDHDRPLEERGERAAQLMGLYMRQRGLIPDAVLCSSAKRARSTAELVLATLGWTGEPNFESSLYGASPDIFLDHIKALPESANSVLIVGHNPDLQNFIEELAPGGDSMAIGRMGEKFPTGALATVQLRRKRWWSISPGDGAVTAFVTPKDLV